MKASRGDKIMTPERFEQVATVTSISEIDALPTDTDAVMVARLDDDKIVALRRLNALRILYQDGNPYVTDVGLSYLVAMPSLEKLDLQRSRDITDEGLKELQLLGNLRWLDLTGCTQLSKRSVNDLKRSLPGCEIVC
jgi:hypothetical protein